MRNILFPSLILLALPLAAGAQEIRLGVLGHDVGVFGTNHEDGIDINGEVLFSSPDFLAPIWSPRPHVGVAVNTAGNTSVAYAGVTWTWQPTERFFFDFSFGPAIHNGKLDTNDPDRVSLGSRVLFRESASIGFNLTERHSISVYLAHISNANLADRNEGMDNLGIRWGYRF